MLAAAREMPTWRSRQLAAWLSDHRGLSVSASTVYRILRREGLVKRIEYQLAAGKEYQHKTTGPHQLWATDASYFRVVGWGYYYLVTKAPDGPVTRELLAKPVQKALNDLGEPVPLESLSKRPGSTRPPELGTILELLYATPQELRGADGELLGSARYIALWWDREGGAPNLVLCGTDDGNHLGAAFATDDLSSFETLMEGAPSSSPHSMVAAERLRPSGYSSDDYQYPYAWEMKTDKAAYVQDELVTLTFTVTNISDWPVTLDYMPPTVTIRSIQEARDVAVLRYGDGHRVLKSGETASFTMTWDQVHFEGGRATPGHYVAHVHLANLADNRWLGSGPTAYELILE